LSFGNRCACAQRLGRSRDAEDGGYSRRFQAGLSNIGKRARSSEPTLTGTRRRIAPQVSVGSDRREAAVLLVVLSGGEERRVVGPLHRGQVIANRPTLTSSR
jgi:hypothetical protein